MVNEEQPPSESLDAIKHKSSQVDALQNQLGNILSGVEKSLAVTCESIMGKMKQLEDKIQDMEKRCTELARDAEQTLKEVDKMEPKGESESTPAAAHVAGESNEAAASAEIAPAQEPKPESAEEDAAAPATEPAQEPAPVAQETVSEDPKIAESDKH